MGLEKLDQEKPFDSAEEHPFLDDDLDGHSWKYRMWKYVDGFPMYYEFNGNGERKQKKKQIKKIQRNLAGRITGRRPLR